MVNLTVKKGISAPAVTSIPEKWSREWFRNFITNFLVNADIRNAVTGPGIVITGNVSGNSISGTSSSVTIGQAPIPNGTVLGNVSGTTETPSALSESQLTTLVEPFSSTTSGAVPASGAAASTEFLNATGTFTTPNGSSPITNDTVLGNVSGSTANPVALNQTQLTSLVNDFTATLSGAVPPPGSSTGKLLSDNGTWVTGSAGTPGGTNTQVQFNNSGAFGGSPNLTWNGSTLSITGAVAATTVNATSDPSLKINIQKLKNYVDILNKINGYTFNWKESGKPSIGVMSTEVKQVAPELVIHINDHDTVNYNGLVAILIEEVKDLRKKVEILEAKIG